VSESVDHVASELYALPPGRFTIARDEYVVSARATGQHRLAAEVAKLRKPTLAAWAVNQLVRDQGEMLQRLLDIGRQLLDAQLGLRAGDLRRLTRQRNQILVELTQRARTLSALAGESLSSATLEQVRGTLTAAVADPDNAREVCSGRLTRALSYSGFGVEDRSAAQRPALRAVPPLPTSDPAPARPEPAPARRSASRGTAVGGPTSRPDAGDAAVPPDRHPDGRLARQLAEAREQLAAATAAVADARGALHEAEEAESAANRRVADLRKELRQAEHDAAGAARVTQQARGRAVFAGRRLTTAQRRVDQLEP